jgi:hypothetical protein
MTAGDRPPPQAKDRLRNAFTLRQLNRSRLRGRDDEIDVFEVIE